MTLTTDQKRAAWAHVDRVKQVELGYVTNLCVNASMLALCEQNGFGKKRIARLAGYTYAALSELYDHHPTHRWLDIIEKRCAALHIPVDPENRQRMDWDGIPPKMPEVIFLKQCKTNGVLTAYTNERDRFMGWFFTNVVISTCAFQLIEHFRFSVPAAQRFAMAASEVVTDTYDLDANVWPDMVEAHLKRLGIAFDGWWIVPEGGELMNWNAAQELYNEQQRRALTSNIEKRKIKHKAPRRR